jgi:SAM-dependent methyltransferase
MNDRTNQTAWSDFWAAGGAGPASGCLPNAVRGIDLAQRAIWEAAARRPSRGSRVLDLASGDAAVLERIRSVRPDLKLIGIDSSPRLPPAPKGVTLKPGVAMERLPFPDSHFALVTSQFGFEYGDKARVAKEVRRVLAPGGRIHFVVHHRGGAIVAHNLARRQALSWALIETGYLEKARLLARSRKIAALLPTPDHFKDAPQVARRRFPSQPVAEEFVTAIYQTLVGSRRHSPDEALEVLGLLERRASNEIARINALEKAACDAEQIRAVVQILANAGLEAEPPKAVEEQGGERIFAWLVKSRE